jgi:hypothetical protein
MRIFLPRYAARSPDPLAFDLQLERVRNALDVDDNQPCTTLGNIGKRAHDRRLVWGGKNEGGLTITRKANVLSVFDQSRLLGQPMLGAFRTLVPTDVAGRYCTRLKKVLAQF